MCGFFFKLDLVTLLFYPFVVVNSIWVYTMWWHVQASRIWRAILPFIHTFALLLLFFFCTHFSAYFEVRHPQLEFKWQYRPLVYSYTFFL